MSTATKGRRNEHRTKHILQAKGYTVIRSAASKGPFDLIAIGKEDILLIQVKTNRPPSKQEKTEFYEVPYPCFAPISKQIWIWYDYKKNPTIL